MEYFDKYNINIKWCCQSWPNMINDKIINNMYNHGCYGITIGLDFFNENILNIFDILPNKKQIEESILICRNNNMKISLKIMIGNPGETIKSLTETFNFCKGLNPDIAFINLSTPIPGTPLYKYCEDNNLLLHKNYNLYTYDNQIVKLKNIPDYQIEKMKKMFCDIINKRK
jgi:radical SAM superfamily enzyme YgiQ (UPF0313 family)